MPNPIIQNRKALHDYEIVERYEAGIVLVGGEVKALRHGRANLQDAFAVFQKGELFLLNFHISPYEHAGYAQYVSTRPRKLLLHKDELRRLQGKLTQKGFTLVPLRVYFNARGYAKVELGLARGKKQYDKRQAIKAKEDRRALERLHKYKGRY
ncbi:MAG: SsrA-binding protein SmpB [Bacteroidia bacterium]